MVVQLWHCTDVPSRYMQQKKEQEEELNRILDKVKKNGYDGLTPEEKRRLFDITRK